MRLFIIALSFVISTSASAEQAPKDGTAIDFTQVLIGINGKPLMEGGDDCKAGMTPGKDCSEVPQTLSDVAVTALEVPIDEDRNLDPIKKYERDELARKIYKNSHAVLSPDDVAKIKERIGKVWNASQIGAAWPLLDPTLRAR